VILALAARQFFVEGCGRFGQSQQCSEFEVELRRAGISQQIKDIAEEAAYKRDVPIRPRPISLILQVETIIEIRVACQVLGFYSSLP
jgi:hypothetical protein